MNRSSETPASHQTQQRSSENRMLEVEELRVTFNPPTGEVRAVRGISLQLASGEILGVAGESGCGKTVLFRSLLGLLPATASVEGSMRFDGTPMSMDGPLQTMTSIIYQNPRAALNPVFTVGQQLRMIAGTQDDTTLAGMLGKVGLPDAQGLLNSYSHELSGGMSQRVSIAFALAQAPRLLIADEPTTALDVTTQAQVLDLIEDMRDRHSLTVVLISHDLAVLRRICDRIVVLYAGRIVEEGNTEQVLQNPSHPYTQALLQSIPRPHSSGRKLTSIPGRVPDGRSPISGCAFTSRCSRVKGRCHAKQPSLRAAEPGHNAACILIGRDH